MPKLRYGLKLFGEFVRFARDNNMYWIVPLMLVLVLVGFVIVAGKSVAPLVYALF
ncbi:MAG: hypothetical protein HRU01_29475 [Myxococcales bacterium]|nr:hypothetical protein [Myxococcales bacterium]